MARPVTPLWTATPSRFSGLTKPHARIGVGLLLLLLLWSLTTLSVAGPPPVSHDPAKRADDRADVVLYETIVAGLRGGGDYYSVTATALRSGDYPLRPFVTFRLPTLAVVQALVPPMVVVLLLYLLAGIVLLVWWRRLKPAFSRGPPRLVAMVLMLGGMAVFVSAELAPLHEVWAALLVALSLALRREDRWVEAVALGLMAMLVRETAALYVVIMAGAALLEGRRREAIGWAATLLVLAIVVALHARAVAAVVTVTDPFSPGWSGLLGFGFFVKATTLFTALAVAPAWLAALLVGLALFGWAAWHDPLALRACTILWSYAALIGIFGRGDTFYWAVLVAPFLLVGLAFVPDGVRDLLRAALDRRRIIVHKRVL